jgi:hypothetical protein
MILKIDKSRKRNEERTPIYETIVSRLYYKLTDFKMVEYIKNSSH